MADLLLPLASAGHAAEVVTEGFKAWAPWLVLFIPLGVAFLVAAMPPLRKRGNAAAALAIAGVATGFILTTVLYFLPLLGGHGATYEAVVDWIVVGDVVIQFGSRLDSLALIMTMVVTGISWPHSISEYFDSDIAPLNPYNNDFPTYVYGTLPLFLGKTHYRVIAELP